MLQKNDTTLLSHAFGMEMPGRKWQASNYRYSHNGQEKETEIFSGANSAEFWMYDSRIGRRWNIDPVVNMSLSPYACFNNNPIAFNDPNGDTPDPDRFKKRKYTDGKFKEKIGRAAATAARGLTVAAKVANFVKLEVPTTMGPFKGQPESELHANRTPPLTSEGATIINNPELLKNPRSLHNYEQDRLSGSSIGLGKGAFSASMSSDGEIEVGLMSKKGIGINVGYNPEQVSFGAKLGFEFKNKRLNSEGSEFSYGGFIAPNRDHDLLIISRITTVKDYAFINKSPSQFTIYRKMGMDLNNQKYYPFIMTANSSTVYISAIDQQKSYFVYSNTKSAVTSYTAFNVNGQIWRSNVMSLHDTNGVIGLRLGATYNGFSALINAR